MRKCPPLLKTSIFCSFQRWLAWKNFQSPFLSEHCYDEDYKNRKCTLKGRDFLFLWYFSSTAIDGIPWFLWSQWEPFHWFNGSRIRPLVKSNIQRHRDNFRLETNPFRQGAPDGSWGLAEGCCCLVSLYLFPISVLGYMKPTFCCLDPACLGWKIEKAIF